MRYSEELKKKIAKAEKIAKKQALKSAMLKKKRKRRVSNGEQEQQIRGKWADDKWGEQGCLYSENDYYWITRFTEGGESYPCAIKKEEYEEHPIKARIEKVKSPKAKRKCASHHRKNSKIGRQHRKRIMKLSSLKI